MEAEETASEGGTEGEKKKPAWKRKVAAGVMVLGVVGAIGAVAGKSIPRSSCESVLLVSLLCALFPSLLIQSLYFALPAPAGLAIPGAAPLIVIVGAAVGGGLIVADRKRRMRQKRRAAASGMDTAEGNNCMEAEGQDLERDGPSAV